MLDIEIIKWGCEFADGFEYEGSTYTSMTILTSLGLKKTHHNNWKDCLYPLFLQKVIEGINHLFSTMDVKYLYSIKQDYSDVEVYYDYEIEEKFSLKESVLQAKEKAIEFIYSKVV
jgi:hypothetical protein